MKKLIIGGTAVFYRIHTGRIYRDFRGTDELPATMYPDRIIRDAIAVYDAADGRKNNKGGTREGAGRKQRTDQPTKIRGVDLTDAEFAYLQFKYGTFASAVRSLFELGWEFEEA